MRQSEEEEASREGMPVPPVQNLAIHPPWNRVRVPLLVVLVAALLLVLLVVLFVVLLVVLVLVVLVVCVITGMQMEAPVAMLRRVAFAVRCLELRGPRQPSKRRLGSRHDPAIRRNPKLVAVRVLEPRLPPPRRRAPRRRRLTSFDQRCGAAVPPPGLLSTSATVSSDCAGQAPLGPLPRAARAWLGAAALRGRRHGGDAHHCGENQRGSPESRGGDMQRQPVLNPPAVQPTKVLTGHLPRPERPDRT